MIAVYFVVFLYNGALFNRSMIFFYHILLKIIPVFVFVYVLMVLTDYYVTPQFVIKHLSGRGLKKWIYVVLGGMVSSGPIYMWYPLLAELRDKGLSYRLITCFLYNRAIKIALIPLAIFYFGWVYVLVLTLVMIFISIVQGFFMEWVMLKDSGNVSS
ncbi:MAG: hypothetical protein GWP09_00180 [Nitrospiraceae bacterium]|nr:hypothetical protein [Nitrospiraceae bacterium]